MKSILSSSGTIYFPTLTKILSMNRPWNDTGIRLFRDSTAIVEHSGKKENILDKQVKPRQCVQKRLLFTRKFKTRISMAKEAFNSKISLLTIKLNIESRMKFDTYFNWNIAVAKRTGH